jgi:hypothetical protein
VGRDEDVDDLAELVDRPVHIPPTAGDLHVGLVDPPATAHGVPARAGGLGQQWREPLHPAVDGDVVDLDPTLGEELLDVAVGQPEAQIQRIASTITSGGKRKPAKADRETGPGGGRRVLIPGVSVLKHDPRRCNSPSRFGEHELLYSIWPQCDDDVPVLS